MKNQALFSSKDKSKKLKCCLQQFLFGALRVKHCAFILSVKAATTDFLFRIRFNLILVSLCLTLKAPITTAADDIHK